MPAKEYNEVKMRGILPSDGMDNIPVTESAPLTDIDSRLWLWDTVNLIWVKGKCNALGEQVIAFDRPVTVTETAPLTSIQVEPKANADSIPVGKIPDGGTQILGQGGVINGTNAYYTVPLGKTLYLLSWILFIDALAAGYVHFYIQDDGAAYKYSLGFILAQAGTTISSISGSAFPPIELPVDWDIVVYSSAAVLSAASSFFGYEM